MAASTDHLQVTSVPVPDPSGRGAGCGMSGPRPSEEDGQVPPPGELDEPLDGTPSPAIQVVSPVDLKRKTALSILWTIVYTGSDYVFSFVVFAVLARQLGPAAFGLFALAVAFAEFGKILPSSGLVSALGRARHVSPEMADTVFWSTLALAGVVAGLLALVAPLLAGALGEPAVAPLLTALGAIFPISALGATHIALMLREFGHKAMAPRSVVSGVLGGAAALTAAWAGWGPWSLVVQRGVVEIAGTAMAWQAYRWLPGRRYSFAVLREMAGLSASITLTQLLFVSLVRVQDVIIGRVIGAPAVGIYRTAWRTIDLIAQGAIMPFSQVSLVTLARLQDDLPAFRKAYLRIISVSSALAFPAIIGFAVLAPDAIPLIFGDQWTESGRIAQLLGLMAVPFTLNRFAGPGLAALGRSGTLARIAALQVALTVLFSLCCGTVRSDRDGGGVCAASLCHTAGSDARVQAIQWARLLAGMGGHRAGVAHGPGHGGWSAGPRPLHRGSVSPQWHFPAGHGPGRVCAVRGIAAALRSQVRAGADPGPRTPACQPRPLVVDAAADAGRTLPGRTTDDPCGV